jgi:signal-transduction protein with cAMP-binding, CBS, and nucleotidyltransferase domain
VSDLKDLKILRGLNETAIFKNIPDDVLIKISKKAELEAFKPEEVIVWEGELSDRLFITINGIVTVKKVIPNKSDKIFAFVARQYVW